MSRARIGLRARWDFRARVPVLSAWSCDAWLPFTAGYTEDMESLFDWLCIPKDQRPAEASLHEGSYFPREGDKNLSAVGHALLRRELATEYFWYDELETIAINGKLRKLLIS